MIGNLLESERDVCEAPDAAFEAVAQQAASCRDGHLSPRDP